MDEIEASIHGARAHLEQVREAYANHFLAAGDLRLVEELLREVARHADRLAATTRRRPPGPARGDPPESDPPEPFRFAPADLRALNRAIDHAAYHQEHGEVRYKVGVVFITADDLRRLIAEQARSPRNLAETRRFLGGLQAHLAAQPLSARQVLAVETIARRHDRWAAEERVGVVRFLRGNDQKLNEMAKKVIFTGLGCAWTHEDASTADVLAFRRRYLDGGRVRLAAVREEVARDLRRKGKTRLLSKYDAVMQRLAAYLDAIDPATYEVDGLRVGRPVWVPARKGTAGERAIDTGREADADPRG